MIRINLPMSSKLCAFGIVQAYHLVHPLQQLAASRLQCSLPSSGVSLAEFRAAGKWAPVWTIYADMEVLEDKAAAEAKVFRRFQCV